MICKDCGNEKFETTKVWRNRNLVDGKRVYSNDTDLRLITCSECGQRYITTTVMSAEIRFNKTKMQKQLKLF